MIKLYTENNYSIIELGVITGNYNYNCKSETYTLANLLSNIYIDVPYEGSYAKRSSKFTNSNDITVKGSDLKSNSTYKANTNTEVLFLTSDSFKIKKVKFNGPATIVFWESGDKTVVKMQNSESKDDREKAIFAAFTKKALSLFSSNSGKEKSIEYIMQKCMKDFVEKIDDNIEDIEEKDE